MDPATATLIAAGLTAAGSIGGGILSNPGNKETKIQKRKRKTIDEILRSLQGEGLYSDLFNMNEEAFQKSFVEPAKYRFQNQIAPQIQQSYIANGQQRGSGVQDTLTRAGVDMDQLLNAQYMDYIQSALDRKQHALDSILGAPEGAAPGMSTGNAALQATGGYLTSDSFGNLMDKVLAKFKDSAPQGSGSLGGNAASRAGFASG